MTEDLTEDKRLTREALRRMAARATARARQRNEWLRKYLALAARSGKVASSLTVELTVLQRRFDAVKADRDRLSDQLTEVNIGRVQAVAALAELVALKDGPRYADYERRKPAAWEAARRALDPHPDRAES